MPLPYCLGPDESVVGRQGRSRRGRPFGTLSLSIFFPPYMVQPAQPTIRKSFKAGSRPIWRAESNCDLHLSIRPLVVAPLLKTSSIFRFSKFNLIDFTPLYHHHHYSQKIRERCSLGLFDALNLVVASVCPWDCWFQLHKQKPSKIPAAKNSAHQTSLPPKSITTYNQKA
jgi:hypothetical protein